MTMESISTNIQQSPRTPPRTKKNSTPHAQVPPPPSRRRVQYTPISGGSSPAIGKTQSLAYYLEATANGELDEWETVTSGIPVVVTDSGSSSQNTSAAVPTTTVTGVSSQARSASSTNLPLTNAQRAAQNAQEQSLNTPSAEVFLNLYEAMRASLAADFQQQYERYQVIISGYQHGSTVKLEDAQQQNTRLRERIVTLEKLRGEERGYWEAEKKNLILRLEKGEDRFDRAERLRKEEELRRKEKDEHDKMMRKIIEKYEAKKKLWAKEKEDIEKEKKALHSRVTELDEENKRLEDIITNDDNVLLEQLGALEKEKNELMGAFDEEKARWEGSRVSLQQDLSLARQTVEKLKKERGTLYWDTKKTLIDVQRENETLNETIGELTRRIEWQQKTWGKEKSIMMARLKEERNDVTALRQQLYENEGKRKREDGHDEEISLHETNIKKSKMEAMVSSGEESDEDDDANEIPYTGEHYGQQEYDDDDDDDDDEEEEEERAQEELDDIVEDQEEGDFEDESEGSNAGSEDELR